MEARTGILMEITMLSDSYRHGIQLYSHTNLLFIITEPKNTKVHHQNEDKHLDIELMDTGPPSVHISELWLLLMHLTHLRDGPLLEH